MLRIWIFVFAVLGTSGCVGINLGQSGGSGGATGAGGAASDAGTAAVGANCGVDPNTGATLCLAISICPQITVDQSIYPECGFRINGTSLDVECSCGGELCPLGSAPDCATLLQLLSQQTEGLVCQQVSEDRCITPMGSTVTSTGTAGSTCDQGCRSDCAGEPTCIQNCGC